MRSLCGPWYVGKMHGEVLLLRAWWQGKGAALSVPHASTCKEPSSMTTAIALVFHLFLCPLLCRISCCGRNLAKQLMPLYPLFAIVGVGLGLAVWHAESQPCGIAPAQSCGRRSATLICTRWTIPRRRRRCGRTTTRGATCATWQRMYDFRWGPSRH